MAEATADLRKSIETEVVGRAWASGRNWAGAGAGPRLSNSRLETQEGGVV